MFTYKNYIYGISGCEAAPYTYSIYYTAEVLGKLYPAADYGVFIPYTSISTVGFYSFPGLIMTNLKPGNEITLVINRNFNII